MMNDVKNLKVTGRKITKVKISKLKNRNIQSGWGNYKKTRITERALMSTVLDYHT